jgi:hypothetical protein
MTGIPVSVAPATAEGRLYPRYDNDGGLLALATDAPSRRPAAMVAGVAERLL